MEREDDDNFLVNELGIVHTMSLDHRGLSCKLKIGWRFAGKNCGARRKDKREKEKKKVFEEKLVVE